MIPDDPPSAPSSRDRLLRAAKALMAAHGYEQTSTAAIARQAGTSESQLMRYFGGKAALLETIFDESWGPLNARVEAIMQAACSSAEALTEVFTLFIDVLERDSALARLFLFEGRRLRGDGINLSCGYLQFLDLLDRQIRRGQELGEFNPGYEPRVLLSALFGAAEAMVRDRLLEESAAAARPDRLRAQIRPVFQALLVGLAPPLPADRA